MELPDQELVPLAIGEKRSGWCPICEQPVEFVLQGNFYREDYRCTKCNSIPRFRALIHILSENFPNWRSARIHESSPLGPSSDKLRRECKDYVASQYWPDRPLGSMQEGNVRCEDIERLTFPKASIDLHITQDVFEHVLRPDRGFQEIERTLKPGGAHVCTVPIFTGRQTLVRVEERDGKVIDLQPRAYHGNPIDESGSLVIREWGDDLPDYVSSCTGLITERLQPLRPDLGIEGTMLDVLVMRKPRIGPFSRLKKLVFGAS